ncbi:N-acetyltransferase [Chitinivorax sp. B]|uniref:GNAT family N-acetyltransferase n=1 Tax=Chitinivorax sp. B TaxID=2502235 RepID=UPI0010F9AF7E|nr:N-acetyltransferase [Chitinivorax sp. B]
MQIASIDATATVPGVAEALYQLQQLAYRLEAELIGFPDLPPLHETVEELAQLRETLLTVKDGSGALIGILGWVCEDGQVDICRLAIHPRHTRQGWGQRLLQALFEITAGTAATWSVTTAVANTPALALYRKLGFVEQTRFHTAEGLALVSLGKISNSTSRSS